MLKAIVAAALLFAAQASAAPLDPATWKQPDAIIIPDPFSGNPFHFDQAFADPKIKAVILKAASGLQIDPALKDRAEEAKRRQIPFGIYLLGLSSSKPGYGASPESQADYLLSLGLKTGATMLALDIEPNEGDISLVEASRFIARFHDKDPAGRYPIVYTNKAVALKIAQQFDATSIFAKRQLWIAGTKRFAGNRVWASFVLWQFAAEWDCPDAVLKEAKRNKISRFKACLPYRQYPVAGSEYDLDINVVNGGQAEYEALFGSKPVSPLVPGPAQ